MMLRVRGAGYGVGLGLGDPASTGKGVPVGVIIGAEVEVGAEVAAGRLHGTPVEIFMSSAVPLASVVGDLARRLSRHGVGGVCGPLVGGAFLAELIAAELDVELSCAERLATPETVDYRVPSARRGQYLR